VTAWFASIRQKILCPFDIIIILKNLLHLPTAFKNTHFLFLESGNLSLEEQPYRGAERKYGFYAFKGYRQLIVENYIIIYEVLENEKVVAVVTVKYGKSEF